MSDPEFTGNETGPYEDPRDNFHYHNHLDPAHQYIAWMHQWKKQHWEIHQACKELGQSTYTDEYVKGFMDGVSMEPPNSVSLNIVEMEEETDRFVRDLMGSNQGT
jgi:hypothetical protein